MSSAPPYPGDAVAVPYPDAPPTYDEAMGLLPAEGQDLAVARAHQVAIDEALARSLTNSRTSSRHPSPTRHHVNPPYPLTATEIVPRDDNPHIIRPYPMGSTGSIVVLQQPGIEVEGVEWVAKPPEEPTCPTGLEYLLDREYVYVKRERKNFLGKRRSFTVRNNYDKLIYLVIETGKVRCAAVDHYERPAFAYIEDWSYAGESRLEIHEGVKAAYFEETTGCASNTQKILDHTKCGILYLDTECCNEGNNVYTIYSRSHATIGSIEKQSPGNKIKIKFPVDLDVRMKAAVVSMAMRLEISDERRRGEYS